jgi:hypothetical protein
MQIDWSTGVVDAFMSLLHQMQIRRQAEGDTTQLGIRSSNAVARFAIIRCIAPPSAVATII